MALPTQNNRLPLARVATSKNRLKVVPPMLAALLNTVLNRPTKNVWPKLEIKVTTKPKARIRNVSTAAGLGPG